MLLLATNHPCQTPLLLKLCYTDLSWLMTHVELAEHFWQLTHIHGQLHLQQEISKSSMKKTFFGFQKSGLKCHCKQITFCGPMSRWLCYKVLKVLLERLVGSRHHTLLTFHKDAPKQCLKGLKHGRKKPRSKPAIRECKTEPAPHKCQTIYALAKARQLYRWNHCTSGALEIPT